MTDRLFEAPMSSSGISRDPIVITSEVAKIREQLDSMEQKAPGYEQPRDHYYVVSQTETEPATQAQSRVLGGNALSQLHEGPILRLPTL